GGGDLSDRGPPGRPREEDGLHRIRLRPRSVGARGELARDHITKNDAHTLLSVRDRFAMPDGKAEMLEAARGMDPGEGPARWKWTISTSPPSSAIIRWSTSARRSWTPTPWPSATSTTSRAATSRVRTFASRGTLDCFHKSWYHFNTSSALWNTSAEEMNRVHGLTKNASFPPYRINKTLSEEILRGTASEAARRRVSDLGFAYNAQTHVECQLPDFWIKQLKDVKILHHTERNGVAMPRSVGGGAWSPERTVPEEECIERPGCARDEGHRWYEHLDAVERRPREAAGKGPSGAKGRIV
ncbi:hypothetical protein ACHAWF_004773, partial [Thalassiosira exigua]